MATRKTHASKKTYLSKRLLARLGQMASSPLTVVTAPAGSGKTAAATAFLENSGLPFCLIDFGTKELYPIQDTLLAYFIRDYWVELDFDKNSVNIKSYYLPKREPT